MASIPAADKRIRKSRQALKEALLELLKRYSFEEITITQIVQHADVNRGTFYNNYQEKEQLLEELLQDVLSDLLRAYRSPYMNCSKFEIHRLQADAVEIFRHVSEHANFYRVVLGSDSLPGFERRIFAFLRSIPLQDLIHPEDWTVTQEKPESSKTASYPGTLGGSDATGDSGIPATSRIRKDDFELWGSFYASGLIGMIGYWIENDFAQSHEYMACQLVDLLNRGSHMALLPRGGI
ncbi:TetR-like C-terminal domain-containing protein [Paenibacillus physcomitrellae]|uniref:TetR family transcriptional regulator n=1 Tax=Paenibacillus physcomitrellae TaxID=1619311 RepID=A0ABQ1FW51_9BACL|nr:TetR/AcrR family transcriptional regulator [Paenibacillus physcomitrellae]GGA31464.1 TetR family transcriptional regulator [Paenibacillus physcomitrellae]